MTSPDGSRTKVYRVMLGASLALEPGFNTVEWSGPDGITVTEALGGISGTVAVVYAWDEAAGTWLAFFPGLEDVPGLNTLATFDQGRTYWIAVTEPVIWNFSAGAPRETVAAAGFPDGGIEIVQLP